MGRTLRHLVWSGERSVLKKVIPWLLCAALLFPSAVFSSEFRFSPNPNKAHLVQWRTWGPAAFAEARKKKKLVLLSLSAVWCHSCHVMDETSYSDDRIISFLNQHFIPVRVDADLRPDIDSLYNQGGWPSTVILLPDGEVVQGGNYFPPEEFLAILTRAAELYRTAPRSIAREVERLRQAQQFEGARMTMTPGEEDIEQIVALYIGAFDEDHAGFGSGQKFPNPFAIDLLLSQYLARRDRGSRRVITRTLDAMARGELYDREAGGFFRYATQRNWTAPHYEKMLDVNAGLIRTYAFAYQVFKRKKDLRIVREAVRYVRTTLYDERSGAFFGSQDANEEYYTARSRRGLQRPLVDRTVYADSASLMISALVTAAGAARDPAFLAMAEQGAGYLLQNLYAEQEGVAHAFRGNTARLFGMLSDNTLFGAAMLDLYGVTGDRRYREVALRTGKLVTGRFYDGKKKQFRSILETGLPRPATGGTLADVNHNLANFRALIFLGRLLHIAPDDAMRAARDAALATFSRAYEGFTPHAAAYGTALLWAFGKPLEITIIGMDTKTKAFLAIANEAPVPEKVVRVLSLGRDAAEIKRLNYPQREAVYLCAGRRCSAPIRDTSVFSTELASFLKGTDRR